MTTPFANITLGTAGHIDHGKTALVRSLTGCETDRLKEEKRRGMSIDLGFAPCLIGRRQVGIVDVPGHEHFVKTMVAGASGMDGVILVVAADDGVMPQTREHLDILTLLGIRHGLVALSKIDRVDAEQRELARAELDDFLRGTFLEGAPILPFSNVTGEGFDAFHAALEALVQSIEPKRIDGVFRLPLERAFSVRGFGTVVAGIPVSGSARTGDEIALLPQGAAGRLKRIEVYGRTSDAVMAGQCAALNVGHWDHHQLQRGNVLTLPGCFSADEWYAATLRLLPRAKLNLRNGADVRFHTGTSEVTAAVYCLEAARMQGGGQYMVQVRMRTPVVAGPGDLFILRSLSPVQTIGGGMIVEATPRRMKRNRPQVVEALREHARAIGDDGRLLEYCLRHTAGPAADAAGLAWRTKLPVARVEALLAELAGQGKALRLAPASWIHRDTAGEAAERILGAVDEFHRGSPESPGMPPDALRQACGLEKPLLEGLLAPLIADGRLVEHEGRLARPGHRPAVPEEQARHLAAIEGLFRNSPFHPPGLDEVAAQTGTTPETARKIVQLLLAHGRLVEIGELWFHREAVDRAREILVAFFAQEGRLESVRFKYLLDTARKYALPLLDYFDRVGVTRRVGNTRHLSAAASHAPPAAKQGG